MPDVCVVEDLPAPVEVAWACLADFGDMSLWSPDSNVLKVEGSEAGCVRTVDSADGRYVEKCEAYSAENFSFDYSLVESPHPYTAYLGTVTLTAIDEQKCSIEWKCDFELPGVKKALVAKAIEEVYRDYFIMHLRKSLEKGA
ncbi:MAG: hypothetical protein CL917_08065 [Deltaproteobacteria bacterium]|nr:hypothetical protein [Deltaproteobacteria bacterium]